MVNPNAIGGSPEVDGQKSEGALRHLGHSMVDGVMNFADFLGEHGLNMVPVKAVPSEHAVHDGPKVSPIDAHAGDHPTWQRYPRNLGS